MIYFIGAGPGDPELLTLKGRRLIDQADVIIYAGSLVNPAVLEGRKADAVVYDSASMDLDQVVEVLIKAERDGLRAVRVHTGDPAIYGAIREQMVRLDEEGISYEVVPGVSSFSAAAAAVKKEYTLPDVTQTVILTRRAGRTPVPEKEGIRELANHQATMVIFLSVGQIHQLCDELREGGYPEDTPAAVVSRASWPDQLIIRGSLADIAEKTTAAGIRRQALVLVGGFLGDEFALSKLYDKHFAHGYRAATEATTAAIAEEGPVQ